MRASAEEYTQLRSYMSASRELDGWIRGARALALLGGAVETGVLRVLIAGGMTAPQIAAATDLDLSYIKDLCLALEVHGVIEQAEGRYQLAPDYARLAAPEAAVPLISVIRQALVMCRTLQAADPGEAAYTALPAEEVLAMAEGAGISALSASPRVGQETICWMMPEVEARWRAGAQHLEVGCGVGNSLLGTVLAYPGVTAVGIEINEQTAAETRRRTGLLGLTDRVEVRCMDACDLQDEGCYDTIQWSQFFFPAPARPVVLAAMRRALKPGGYLFMPWLGPVVDDSGARRREMVKLALRGLRTGGFAFLSYLNDLLGDSPARRKKESRFAALQRLLFRRWGVPVRSVSELVAEVEAGGFKVLRAAPTPISQFALTRGFLLAQLEYI